MAEQSKKLVITDADLPPPAPPTPPVPAAAPPTSVPYAPGSGLPSVEGVKPAPMQLGVSTASSNWFVTTMGANVVGGLLAALVAWGICELIFGEEEWTRNLVGHSATYFGVFGLLFGGIFTSWEDVVCQAWEKAARNALIGAGVGAVMGAISGAIAQWIYGKVIRDIIRNAIENSQNISATDIRLDLTRGLGWGILGLGIGLGAGIARRSSQKTINALIGGLLGGFIGGFFFNFIGKATESASTSRFLTSMLVGLLIGLGVGLIEIARRQAWLKIVGGGMTGKEFILYWPNANVGSSPKAEITLIKDPAVASFHLRIDSHGNRRSMTTYQGCQVNVNGTPVVQHWLRNGDQVQLGMSTLLYSERALTQ
jgi:hypothetical protein